MSLFSEKENSKESMSSGENQIGLTQKQRELLLQEKKRLLEEDKRLEKGVLGKIWIFSLIGAITFVWIGNGTNLFFFNVLGIICFLMIAAIPVIGFANLSYKGQKKETNKKRLKEIEFQLAGR